MTRVCLRVALQCVVDDPSVPPPEEWSRWATAASEAARNGNDEPVPMPCELTIRLVDENESESLNSRYRQRTGPTNVLAFEGPTDASAIEEGERALGDIVICLPLAFDEAREQGKDPLSHLAHLTVHGTLHLLGFDHVDETLATTMETLETAVMASLGYPDPYAN